MKNGHPLVSIGMAVRNCQGTLPLTLRSLLMQTYSDWELVLIDDGSSDETVSVAKQFADPRISLRVEKENLGLPARLNQAIEQSRGKYFARMDGDDIAYPQRLERQVAFLEAHPDVDLLGTWVVVFNKTGKALGKRAGSPDHQVICARPFAGFPIVHPTYLGKLDWFRRFRYDERILKSQDQDLLLRSYRTSKFANLPEILLGYREERIELSKTLAGRYFFVSSLMRESRRQRYWLLAILGAVEHGMKAGLEIISIATGLNYRLLRHRAQPVTLREQAEWEQVWKQVNCN